MRAFWAILGVLMLASAVYLLLGGGGRESSGAPGAMGARTQPKQLAREMPPAPSAAAQNAARAPDPIEGGGRTNDRTTFPAPVAGAGESGGPAAAPGPTEQAKGEPEGKPASGPATRAEEKPPAVTTAAPGKTEAARPDASGAAGGAVAGKEEERTGDQTPAKSDPTKTAGAPAGAPGAGEATKQADAQAEREPEARAEQPETPEAAADGGTPVSPEAPPSTTVQQPSGGAKPEPTGAEAQKSETAGGGTGDRATGARTEENWLITREDGSMVADGRYTIRGKGTAEAPYKISWEHLISAEEDYVPREGRTEIPKRIAMLHEKYVEITGYVAFPMLMDEADELLVMLNQWDGCCIGVPPTPYDAIEVRLKDFVTGNARLTSYGTLKGVLKVEPHLVGEWLVGLYLMEHGELSPLAYGGFAP